MCDQQRLRSACAYAQSDQSLCSSLEYSMSVKLLTEHLLEVLSLKAAHARPILHVSKCHIIDLTFHQPPYSASASKEGSGESVQLRRLSRVFFARL